MNTKLKAILIVLLFIISCGKKQILARFTKIDLGTDYVEVGKYWQDTTNKIFLVGKSEDLGAMGHNYLICLAKIFKEDTYIMLFAHQQ